MSLRAQNHSPRVPATLNPQSTCHGPRPGPRRASWCPGGLPICRGAESRRKDPRPKVKKMPKSQKNTFIHSNTRLPFREWDDPRGATQAGMLGGRHLRKTPEQEYQINKGKKREQWHEEKKSNEIATDERQG